MSKKITQQERKQFAATADTMAQLAAELKAQTERTEAAALLAENAAADCHKNLTMAIGAAECARDFCKCARAYNIVQSLMFWVTLCATLAYMAIIFYALP